MDSGQGDVVTGADYIGWSPYVNGNPNENFWVVINRDRFGYNNYSRYVLRRDTVRNMFDRRVVRVHSGTLHRTEAERITRRSIRVVPVNVKQVVADRHNTRLILPKGHETAALKQISHVSKKISAPHITKKPVVKKNVVEKKSVTQISGKSSSKVEQHKVVPAISAKTSTKTVQQHKVEPARSTKTPSKTVKTVHKTEPTKIQPISHPEVTPISHGSKYVEKANSKPKETSSKVQNAGKASKQSSTSSKSKPSQKSSSKSKRKPPHH